MEVEEHLAQQWSLERSNYLQEIVHCNLLSDHHHTICNCVSLQSIGQAELNGAIIGEDQGGNNDDTLQTTMMMLTMMTTTVTMLIMTAVVMSRRSNEADDDDDDDNNDDDNDYDER